MSCLSIFSASAFGIISFVTKAEKEICASAKAAIVNPAACSGLLKSSSSVIEQLPCRLVFALLGNPKLVRHFRDVPKANIPSLSLRQRLREDPQFLDEERCDRVRRAIFDGDNLDRPWLHPR